MKIYGKQKKNLLERKWAHSLHSHETRRGRGRRCWVKADKKFASWAKRKRKKEKKKKEKCVYLCKEGLPRQAQVIFTATMHDVGIRCVDLRLVALPTALYLQRCPVSFVRGTCVLRLCCRFHMQARKWTSPGVFHDMALPGLCLELSFKVVSVELARNFYVTKLSKE